LKEPVLKEEFWSVFEETPCLLVISRLSNGEYLAVNRYLQKLLGFRPEEVVGKTTSQFNLLEHPEERDRLAAALVEKGRVEDEQVTLRTESGEKVLALLSSNLVRFRGEVCLLTSISDITRLKQAEGELRAYQQQLRRMAVELTLAEQQERRKLATDLHGTLGQMLALSRMKLASVKKAPPEEVPQQLDEILEILDSANRYARTLVAELSPPILHLFGFVAAAEWLTEKFREQYGLDVGFEADDSEAAVPEEVSVLIFQSLRELLTNVVRHAQADHAKVTVRKDGSRLLVDVEDNGVGFEAAKVNEVKPDGFGLFNIRERLEHLGGNLQVQSGPGTGTTVTLACPIAEG
jgi:two-component system, NarL family, sensor histidine kinase UhpB